ncbi:hypothetical protein M8J76_000697 [Diaphorina citri]|nr:hypothetical protein M8J76_000697 [Diaphorina citri]
MSTVTVTEITETSFGNENEPDIEVENAYIVEEVKVDEKGEETDVETDEDGVKNLTDVKKKRKKLRRELSTSQKSRALPLTSEGKENEPRGYSSSEESQNLSKFKRKDNNVTIRRRIVKKTDKDDKERSRRGKSEPKELTEESSVQKATKKTWWPWTRSKSDHRQVQTDGETSRKSHKGDESSDEFWKSASFRQKRKDKPTAKSLEDVTKASVASAPPLKEPVKPSFSVATKEILTDEITVEIIPEPVEALPKITWRQFKLENAHAWRRLVVSRNRCVSLFIAFSIYLGLGALAIRFIEGAFENFYKCGVKRVKRDFIDTLWDRRYGSEDEWKSMARRTLLNFENELQTAFEAGVKSYSGQQSWSFINSFMYCLNVVSTIGYGNISPSTNTGRAFTIMYAIFGIPIFLIVLADFGKLFTRAIKFVWAYVRRLYYTGSCRKVRRTGPVQEVMKGVKMVVDVTQQFRRPSQVISPEEQQNMNAFSKHLETPGGATPALSSYEIDEEFNLPISLALLILLCYIFCGSAVFVQWNALKSGATPALSSYEIDEEFNLPISLALLILLCYIFCGAAVFVQWESWTFFESFYFVFISMSTIGFGDVVPQHQMYMMASIAYLLFGLALTSMCINVVQEKLSDSFRQASAKLGATIGFQVEEDTGNINPVSVAPSNDLPEVHKTDSKKKKKS